MMEGGPNATDADRRRDIALDAPNDVDWCMEIRQAALDAVIAHARDDVPNECCGLLAGAGGRVERAIRARNTAQGPTRYAIDPEDHFAAIRNARAEGETIVGFYHSHPASAPFPSETDIREAAYPGHCYLIVTPGVGLQPDEVRAYRWEANGNFRPIRLVPLP